MKKLSWSLIMMVLVAVSCQVQDDPMDLSKNASSAGPNKPPTTAASYLNTFTTSADGKTLTVTITGSSDGSAKDISHLLFQFVGCASENLTVANITDVMVGNTSYMSAVGSTEGQGNDCYGLYQDPFVKLDQGFALPVSLTITFDEAVQSGTMLIKAGSSNSPTGGGCFGLNDPRYSFSRTCTPPPTCYDEDSAWAAGSRYVTRGNWATFTTYASGSSVNIYAGQNKFAGTATMSAISGGNVTITISLNAGWSLQEVSNPVKINGYSEKPSGNPSPGRFASKGSSLTVTVPAAAYYGIHLDVRQAVACPE